MLSADKGSFIIGRKTGQKHEKTRKEEESEMFARKKKSCLEMMAFFGLGKNLFARSGKRTLS